MGELLSQFDIQPSSADETADGLPPDELVLELSRRKAFEVACRKGNEGKIVIGSDTVVALDGRILGKPKTEEEAFSMLSSLSGRSHAVYTGVCFAQNVAGELRRATAFERTEVRFRTLTPDWIWEYIRSGSPMDKAGAYGIQDGGLAEGIEGSYTNVVGFPKELVERMIRKAKEEWYDKAGD